MTAEMIGPRDGAVDQRTTLDSDFVLPEPKPTWLPFDIDLIQGRMVTAVLAQHDGADRWWAVALMFGSDALVIEVDRDTDEVLLTYGALPEPEDQPWLPATLLSEFTGQSLGWCWLGRNSQGYVDSFSISLSDWVWPDFCFIGAASTLTCRRLSQMSAP
jgi:hypothetical protein